MVVPRKGNHMISSKICFKCHADLPLTEFYKHPMMADGHVNKCKNCNKKDVTDNRNKNIERIRAYDRDRSKNPERMKIAREISNAWRQSDSRIGHCHNQVARALRSGALVRLPCSVCGAEKSLAHHESYNRPLDVTWLCQPHHKARHKEMVLADIDPLAIERTK